jgi:hypothetical protein
VQSKLAWPELFDWLARQPALGGRPLALIGLGEAARDCIAAAARFGGGRLKSLVLLDAAIGRARHPLERLSLPTLFVLGHADERRLAHCRAALRGMPAAHRLVVLPQPTLPRPAPGALEAFACSALEWLGRTLPHPTGDESRHVSTLPADRRVAGWQPPAAAAGQR